MCKGCWDLDRRAELEKNGVDCSGTDLFKTQLNNMKQILESEWSKTSKTHFRIDNRSVTDFKGDHLEWEAVNPLTQTKAIISIDFIAA